MEFLILEKLKFRTVFFVNLQQRDVDRRQNKDFLPTFYNEILSLRTSSKRNRDFVPARHTRLM